MHGTKRFTGGMVLVALLALAVSAVEAGQPPGRTNGQGAASRPGLIIVVCGRDRAAPAKAARSGAESSAAPKNGFFDIFTGVAQSPRRPGRALRR